MIKIRRTLTWIGTDIDTYKYTIWMRRAHEMSWFRTLTRFDPYADLSRRKNYARPTSKWVLLRRVYNAIDVSFGLDRCQALLMLLHSKFKTPIEEQKKEKKSNVCATVWESGTREKLHSMCRFYTWRAIFFYLSSSLSLLSLVLNPCDYVTWHSLVRPGWFLCVSICQYVLDAKCVLLYHVYEKKRKRRGITTTTHEECWRRRFTFKCENDFYW